MSPASNSPKKQTLWINLLLGLASSLVFLAAIEGILLLARVRPLSLTEDPYVGFAAGQPLFIKKTGTDGIERYETNPVKLTHFNPQSFPVKKTPGTYRIFTLGGSTTYGHPYRDPTSYSGWLREFLAEADSSRHFEVINCGGISYASYREAQLVAELTQYQPDLFIIYAGHNEFLEERTYRGARNLPGWVRETSALLDRTRTYSVMRRTLRNLSKNPEKKSGKTQLAEEEANILERTIGPVSYTRNDTLRQEVLDHYAASLRRIARLAHSAGAQALFVSTPSNEKDCSPFKSEPTPGIPATHKGKAAHLLELGRKYLDDSNSMEAWLRLDSAAQLDPRNAEILYQTGRAAFELKHYPEAKKLFRQALDEDICPLRALTPMREIAHEVAKETDSRFLDFTAIMEQKTQEAQGYNILGEPDFLDHVHLNVEDYGVLARNILEELDHMGVIHPSRDFNASGVEKVRVRVLSRLTPSEEGLGLHNIAKVLNWAGKQEDAARIAERGLVKDSTSLEAIWSSLFVGASLERHGKSRESLPHYRRALRLDSSNSETRRLYGEALTRAGDSTEALVQLREAEALDPGNPEIRRWLANLEFNRKNYSEAAAHFQFLLRVQPGDIEMTGMLAAAYVELGRFDQAQALFEDIAKRSPNSAQVWFGLGYLAERRGNIGEAIQDYGRSSQLDPGFIAPQQALTRLLGGMK
ncbi:MAG TPA: hypothetical protein DCQ83_09370 [Fibrobacteres bacterium]|nr:hypothetical protein [Fibrobacterota bacterium]